MPTREENAAAAVALVQTFVPKFERIPKAGSKIMALLGALLSVVGVRKFMTNFSTTLGYKAYLVEGHYTNISVIFHEGLHADQCKRYTRPLQGALYLLPQLFAILALIPCVVLLILANEHVVSWDWWPLALVLLCGLPLPAYFRMKFEFDAYCVSMAVRHWCNNDVDDNYINSRIRNFTTFAYYLMWPFHGFLQTRFLRKLEWIKSPKVVDDPYYAAIHLFLETRGLLAKKLPLSA